VGKAVSGSARQRSLLRRWQKNEAGTSTQWMERCSIILLSADGVGDTANHSPTSVRVSSASSSTSMPSSSSPSVGRAPASPCTCECRRIAGRWHRGSLARRIQPQRCKGTPRSGGAVAGRPRRVLDLDEDGALDQQVDSIAHVDEHIVVADGERLLALDEQSTTPQLVLETGLMRRLEESRSQCGVDVEGFSQNAPRSDSAYHCLSAVENGPLAHLAASEHYRSSICAPQPDHRCSVHDGPRRHSPTRHPDRIAISAAVI